MLDGSTFERLCIVLVSTRNPLNIGAVARAMKNFGCHRLRVVHPHEAAFREARSAVGAEELLANAEEYDAVDAAVADCTLVVGTTAGRRRELRHSLLSLQDAAPIIRQELYSIGKQPRNVALLFGPEKHGLSNQDLSHCHWLMHIPTRDEQPSINLGQAAAICLYELRRETGGAPPANASLNPATGEEVERITAALLDTLHISGYTGARPSEDHEENVRRLINRMNISSADTSLWLGILRQILWKLRSKP